MGSQFEEVLKKNIDYSTSEKGVLVYKLQADFKAGLWIQIHDFFKTLRYRQTLIREAAKKKFLH